MDSDKTKDSDLSAKPSWRERLGLNAEAVRNPPAEARGLPKLGREFSASRDGEIEASPRSSALAPRFEPREQTVQPVRTGSGDLRSLSRPLEPRMSASPGAKAPGSPPTGNQSTGSVSDRRQSSTESLASPETTRGPNSHPRPAGLPPAPRPLAADFQKRSSEQDQSPDRSATIGRSEASGKLAGGDRAETFRRTSPSEGFGARPNSGTADRPNTAEPPLGPRLSSFERPASPALQRGPAAPVLQSNVRASTPSLAVGATDLRPDPRAVANVTEGHKEQADSGQLSRNTEPASIPRAAAPVLRPDPRAEQTLSEPLSHQLVPDARAEAAETVEGPVERPETVMSTSMQASLRTPPRLKSAESGNESPHSKPHPQIDAHSTGAGVSNVAPAPDERQIRTSGLRAPLKQPETEGAGRLARPVAPMGPEVGRAPAFGRSDFSRFKLPGIGQAKAPTDEASSHSNKLQEEQLSDLDTVPSETPSFKDRELQPIAGTLRAPSLDALKVPPLPRRPAPEEVRGQSRVPSASAPSTFEELAERNRLNAARRSPSMEAPIPSRGPAARIFQQPSLTEASRNLSAREHTAPTPTSETSYDRAFYGDPALEEQTGNPNEYQGAHARELSYVDDQGGDDYDRPLQHRASAAEYQDAYRDYEVGNDKSRFLSGRLPIYLGGALLLVIAVVAVVIYMLSGGSDTLATSDSPPVIAAPTEPTKIQPQEATNQPVVPRQTKLIYDRILGEEQGGAEERLVPRQEEPLTPGGVDEGGTGLSPGDQSGTQGALPVPLPPPPPSNGDQSALPSTDTVTMARSSEADTSAVEDDGSIPVPGMSPSEPPSAPIATTAPPSASPPLPRPKPQTNRNAAGSPTPTGSASSVQTQATAMGTPAAYASPVAQQNPPAGQYLIQLASFRTAQDATSEFNRLKNNFPALVGNLSSFIQEADLGSRGKFYRLRLGPVASKDDASQLCNSLIASGEKDCLVRRQ